MANINKLLARGEKKAAKKGKKKGKGGGQFDLPQESGSAALQAPPSSAPTSQFSLEQAPAPGKQRAITADSLRELPLDEAIAKARTEQHIIPSKAKGEGFVGAPYAATDRAAIDKLRANFDADVGLGGGGADWYQRAQAWIERVAGPDPKAQSELARNLALFSAQADPSGNLGFSIKARNSAITGIEPEGGVVRTGQQWNTYKRAFDDAAELERRGPMFGHNGGPPLDDLDPIIRLGKKTGVYADHMDPTRTSPTTGTNDIWHARALGYTEPEITGGLSPQKHAWMDAETVLAVDRANKAKTAGRTDWTPGEVQAAPWVAGKGRGLMERRGMTLEEGIDEASKTYPDYAPQFTAYATHEQVPGKTTGHLPSIGLGDQETRDAFGGDWRGAGDRDVLYGAQGAITDPTTSAQGIFGDQFNPMEAAHPMVAFSGPGGARVVDPASKQLLTGTEGFRAMMDAQDAGAWSIAVPGQKVSHNNALDLTVPGTDREMLTRAIVDKGAGLDPSLFGTIHYGGDRSILTNFDPAGAGVGNKQARAAEALLPPGSTATPTRLEGDLIDYSKQWRGGAKKGQPPREGSDMVTKKMLKGLTAQMEAGLDKPEVRQKVLERFERDAQAALERGDVVREDLQRARKLFAEGGFKALRDNLGKGLLPAAAAGLFLTQRQTDEGA